MGKVEQAKEGEGSLGDAGDLMGDISAYDLQHVPASSARTPQRSWSL